MRRRPLSVLLTPLLLGALVACSDEGDDSAERSGADDTTTTIDQVDDEVGIELLEPGAEPRRVLLLDPPAGCEQEVTLTQELSQTIEIDGQEQNTKSGTAYDQTHRCIEVTPDSIEVATDFGAAEIIF